MEALPLASLLRALLALVFTVSLLLVGAWAWRRYAGRLGLPALPGAAGRVRLVESKRLTATLSIHIVRVDETEHILATNAAQTTVIGQRKAAKSRKV